MQKWKYNINGQATTIEREDTVFDKLRELER